ncbi:hypothetical protein C488_21297 [Natrinema pellirubrum DSM 15624]|uniref:Uncharacterized protein n=1 Tax=Natrinema pellirubrum (strain DSM 15624 / CIP 106293 / JCM 10476 / NCIMB 786 / 157) TaxID=797303 RepID=L0JR09_NATP1|nr:hypothetical protein Natpe_3938 [Natrinema pellirubrum DSM 15624]ELY68195.1 hypothetical protein C488_21297 [Natrinema pellirubrum DSM 15624]
MVIVPHADFQPDDGPLMLVDLDDVIDVRDDGTGMMTREAWDIIQSLGGYAEVSPSMTRSERKPIPLGVGVSDSMAWQSTRYYSSGGSTASNPASIIS